MMPQVAYAILAIGNTLLSYAGPHPLPPLAHSNDPSIPAKQLFDRAAQAPMERGLLAPI